MRWLNSLRQRYQYFGGNEGDEEFSYYKAMMGTPAAIDYVVSKGKPYNITKLKMLVEEKLV